MATLTPSRRARHEDRTLRIAVLIARAVLIGGALALVVFALD